MHVCILTRKNLSYNTRVFRQAKSLSEAGHRVTVACIKAPHVGLRRAIPDVRFIEIDPGTRLIGRDQPLIAMLIWAISRLEGRRRRRSEAKAAGGEGGAPPRTCDSSAKAQLDNDPFGYAWLLPWYRLAGLIDADEVADRTREERDRMAKAVTGYLRGLLYRRIFVRRLAQRIDIADFDLVQVHDAPALGVLAALLGRRTLPGVLLFDAVEIPLVSSNPAQDLAPASTRQREARLHRDVLARCSASTITVSHGLADWLGSHYDLSDVAVVRNFQLYVEPPAGHEIRQDLGLEDGQRLVLYLNSLYGGQGLEQLIDAIPYLPAGVVVATLGPMIYPEYVKQLTTRATAAGVGARFRVLPPKPPSDMLAYAAGADIGVIPRQNVSLNNTISLPNRVFELVMARLPIAAPSLPDIKAFVLEHGLGQSFDERDPRDIARVIKAMLEPETLARLRDQVQEKAKELCWEREGERYVRLLEAAAEAKRCGKGKRGQRDQSDAEPAPSLG